MNTSELLAELFGRIPDEIRLAVDGLSADDLAWVPADGTNSIGWLVWHSTRVQDDHVADLMDDEQLWATGSWATRFGLEPDRHDTGYGHSAADVARVRPENAAALLEYYDAVAARTNEFLSTLSDADLDRIVDTRWDPPVTLGVRLISIADDDIQHAGQACYVRGLLDRR
jgi:uncharacterized damage-inducible protein DinB